MSYRIIKNYWSWYDSSISRTITRCLIFADSYSDLPVTVDSIPDIRLSIGCEAIVIDTASKYMMQSNGVWSVQDTGNDVYTKSEIDTILTNYTTYNNAYGIDVAGTIDSAGDDLDLYKSPNNYYCPNTTVASSLQNCPTSLPFRLEVRTLNGATRYIQRIIDGNPNNSIPHVYYRVFTANGWGNWYSVNLTQV